VGYGIFCAHFSVATSNLRHSLSQSSEESEMDEPSASSSDLLSDEREALEHHTGDMPEGAVTGSSLVTISAGYAFCKRDMAICSTRRKRAEQELAA